MIGQDVAVEDRLVCEIGHGADAGDRRDRRIGTGCDDDATGANRAIADGNLARPDKARLGAHHINTEPLETLGRIMRCDRVYDAAHMSANRGIIDIRRGAVYPEAAGGPHGMRHLRGGEQRL